MNSTQLNRLHSIPVDFDIKESFLVAWSLFKAQAILHVMYMMLVLSIQGLVVIYLKDYVLVYSVLLAPPLYTGFFLVANKISAGEPVIYPDFFGGFRFWIPMVTISLLTQVLIAFGLLALVIPGIYLAVAYLFSTLMAIFGGMDVWSAMEWSRKLITRNWWRFFALFLILVVINVIGLLLAGIGLLITLPITFLVLYVVFEKLTKDVFAADESLPTHEPQA